MSGGRSDEFEAIALRIRQLACTAGELAERQEESLGHALHMFEETLIEVEERVERLPVAVTA